MEKARKFKTVGSFSRGFSYPFGSFAFIFRRPRLYRYIVIPIIINVAVFTLAVYLGLGFFENIVTHYIPRGEAWYWSLLAYFLRIVAWLVTAVLVFFSFSVVGNLIASPFNDLLSERTEEMLAGHQSDEPFSLKIFIQDARRTVIEEGKKISVFVTGMALLLLLHLFPGMGSLLYTFLSFFWTVFFLIVEYTGYVFSRKRRTFREQQHFIMGRKLLLFGFGLAVLCILAIPFFQFFCIPLAVVGATRLCYDTGDRQEDGDKGVSAAP